MPPSEKPLQVSSLFISHICALLEIKEKQILWSNICTVKVWERDLITDTKIPFCTIKQIFDFSYLIYIFENVFVYLYIYFCNTPVAQTPQRVSSTTGIVYIYSKQWCIKLGLDVLVLYAHARMFLCLLSDTLQVWWMMLCVRVRTFNAIVLCKLSSQDSKPTAHGRTSRVCKTAVSALVAWWVRVWLCT